MKKILVLNFSSLPEGDFYTYLLKEFASRPSFKNLSLKCVRLEKEVSEFDLPVGSRCVFRYNFSNEEALVFNVSKYIFEANRDFLEQTKFIHLDLLSFYGRDVKRIVDYLEKEWKV